jgi:CheY-like chemotaxis protein
MEILNDVLDHSKIEAGKLNLATVPMSIHAMVLSVISLFRANAEGKGLRINLELEPEVPDWVIGDPQRLKQVLLNLIGNAIKFTDHGEVSLNVESIPSKAPIAGIRFKVRDTGLGISDEALPRLFQPFHQVAPADRRKTGGTGLGLAISQRIVEAMDSRIEVYSEVGIGSTFSFTVNLPRDTSSDHPIQYDSALGGLDSELTLQGDILIVEDNDVNRMIAREVLLSLGLNVFEACNGMEAVQLISERSVDAILMDCLMPIMDGYVAAQEIRKLETKRGLARTPILALTANAFDEDAMRAKASGMDGHLAKPYTRNAAQGFAAAMASMTWCY